MMMRSFNKRLKMSKARSPIPEDSMTIGTKGMPRFAVFMRGVARRRAWRSMFFVFSRQPAYGVTDWQCACKRSYVEAQGWDEPL